MATLIDPNAGEMEGPMDKWEKEDVRDFWHSAELDKIGLALAKAQGEIAGADKSSVNPHFRSKYADLASIWNACRGPLAKNEIAVVQMPAVSCVVTMLVHSSGQFFASRLTMKARDDSPQSIGSIITYGRRYGLAAMTGVAPEEDDGNAASGRDDDQRRAEAVSQPRPRPVPPQTTPTRQNSALNGSVETMWKKMLISKTDTLDVFASLKSSLYGAIGKESGERAYYAALGKYGVEHANEFKKSSDARLAAKEMLDMIHDAVENPFDEGKDPRTFGGQ